MAQASRPGPFSLIRSSAHRKQALEESQAEATGRLSISNKSRDPPHGNQVGEIATSSQPSLPSSSNRSVRPCAWRSPRNRDLRIGATTVMYSQVIVTSFCGNAGPGYARTRRGLGRCGLAFFGCVPWASHLSVNHPNRVDFLPAGEGLAPHHSSQLW